MTTHKPGPRFTIERVDAAWQVLLRDGDTVHSIPVVADPEPYLQPGPGPGGLLWNATHDGSVAGLEARWSDGAFKILRFTTSQCALFHERAAGDWTVLALGRPEGLKARAAELAGRTRASDNPAPSEPISTCLASDVPGIPPDPAASVNDAAKPPARPKQQPQLGLREILMLKRMKLG